VRSIHDESPKIPMASINKRRRPDSDSDDDFGTLSFKPFLVIESLDPDKPITKLSPFVIEKTLSGILGTPKSVKKLKNESILVECNTKIQADNLLKNETFFGQRVNIHPHSALNSSRGVIKCKDLSYCDSIEEITNNLSSQGVTSVKRITVTRDGKKINTNTYILDFDSPTVPAKLKIGYQLVNVNVYIPNPLRCYRCQKFGHHESRCTQTPVCGGCSFVGQDHDSSTCRAEIKCANCKKDHRSNSKECLIWKVEKETLKIKYTQNISFPEARKLAKSHLQYEQQQTTTITYAKAAAPTPSSCQSCELLLSKLNELWPEISTQLKKLISPDMTTPSVSQTSTTSSSSESKKSSKESNSSPKPTAIPKNTPHPERQHSQKSRSSSPGHRVSGKAAGARQSSASKSPVSSGHRSRDLTSSDRKKKAEKNLVLANRFEGLMDFDVSDSSETLSSLPISPVRPPK
jgi:hypothetical protein